MDTGANMPCARRAGVTLRGLLQHGRHRHRRDWGIAGRHRYGTNGANRTGEWSV